MSESPNIYLNDPDPLSILLAKLNLTAEVYVNGDFCGAWAVDTSGSKRIPFHLIGTGTAWLHIDDKEPQQISAHDLIIFPHDSHHAISNSPHAPAPSQINAPMSNDGAVTNMICGFFEFKNPVMFTVLEALPKALVLKSNDGEASERIEFLIKLLLTELRNSRPGFYTVIDQIAFLIFVEVLRRQVESGHFEESLLNALFDPRLGKALTAIHQSPQSPWTLESLAEQAVMSRSKFSDTFSKAVGQTPMKYLTKWRMSEARQLLKTTQFSVAQIAEKSGYESEAAFRKAYRNIMGEPPGAIRSK